MRRCLLASLMLVCAWPAQAERIALQRLSLGDVGGWLEVVVQVNGQPGRWIIDTGSTRHIVSRTFAEQHALSLGASVRVDTALGPVAGTEVSLPTLRLGAWAHGGQTALRIDDLARVLGPASEGIDGILGLPLLKGHTLDLNLRDWALDITPSSAASCPAGTSALELGEHRGLPVISVAIDGGASESLLLDTGNPAAVARIEATPNHAAAPGLALATRVSIGALQRTQVPVVRLIAPALHRALSPRIQGLAGTALIDGTRWVIDLDQRRACVEPEQRPVPGGFGLTLARRDGGVFIETVLPDSPAARAGLRDGDAVLHWVDGPPADSLRAVWARVQGQETIEVQAGTAPRTALRRAHFLPALP
ncbi:retropepsin-like aspartic protease [Hydrogenophaga sp.]|uniref:retropepsin-like aspartic protease n=1 Tax=Hydrogenophaga sp. TaxID=1904254 RepID=UPI00272FD3F1|nr:aspartyl protease family protein [Hydrogenophaga sp.]MDP1683730.1 aspartyl protease family protein [Hydrogenophaga sp.]